MVSKKILGILETQQITFTPPGGIVLESGQGLEIDEQAIYKCVARGLNVLHGDLDSGLSEYLDYSFDYVILNQCLQQLRHVETVFTDSLRVGKKVIVGFPNFAHFTARLQLGFKGRAPVTPALPYAWFDTPNLHFLVSPISLTTAGSEG